MTIGPSNYFWLSPLLSSLHPSHSALARLAADLKWDQRLGPDLVLSHLLVIIKYQLDLGCRITSGPIIFHSRNVSLSNMSYVQGQEVFLPPSNEMHIDLIWYECYTWAREWEGVKVNYWIAASPLYCPHITALRVDLHRIEFKWWVAFDQISPRDLSRQRL